MGRTPRWAFPPPISLSPAQAPEKWAILGETPVVPIPIPAPSQGSEMQGETELERQSKCRRPVAKQTKTKPETGRQRHTDHPKRLIGRDTIQRPLTAIFDPPPQNQGEKKEDPKPKGPTEDPQGLGVQRRWVFQLTSPLPKNLNRSESGARRELGLGGGVGDG